MPDYHLRANAKRCQLKDNHSRRISFRSYFFRSSVYSRNPRALTPGFPIAFSNLCVSSLSAAEAKGDGIIIWCDESNALRFCGNIALDALEPRGGEKTEGQCANKITFLANRVKLSSIEHVFTLARVGKHFFYSCASESHAAASHSLRAFSVLQIFRDR